MTEEKFTFFWDGPFSQWHPCEFMVQGTKYNCAEQFMMAEKAELFKDYETLAKIMASNSPRDQKQFGRGVKDFDVPLWQQNCKLIVYRGNLCKFLQNPELLDMLRKTAGTTLVEASPYDEIWGIGLPAKSGDAQKRETWKGLNWLGEILTQLRKDLRLDTQR